MDMKASALTRYSQTQRPLQSGRTLREESLPSGQEKCTHVKTSGRENQISGEWRTHYIASSNTDKTGENGPFNVYLRSIKFNDKGDSLVFHFFVKNNGACTESSVSGRRIANNVYVAEYAGANEFHFILVSDDGLIVNTENVDEAGNRTRLVGLLGKEDEVDDHDLERFLEEVRKLGIPEENIVDFTKGGDCPPCTQETSTTSERDGKWEIVRITGKKEDDNTYVFEYEGTTKFIVKYASCNVLVVCVINIDEEGNETKLAAILVKVDIEAEVLELFNEPVKAKGIEEKDILKIFESDEGTKRLKVAYLSDTVLILCVFNVDEQGVGTPCAVILAVKISVNQEVMDIFNKLISEKDIKEENVVNFIESEDCPPCVLLETRTTSGSNGNWEIIHVTGIRQADGTCALDINIEDEALARFKELVEEKKIEEKYIVNFLKSDDGPPLMDNKAGYKYEGITKFKVTYASDTVLVPRVAKVDENGERHHEPSYCLVCMISSYSHQHCYETLSLSELLSIKSICGDNIHYAVYGTEVFMFHKVFKCILLMNIDISPNTPLEALRGVNIIGRTCVYFKKAVKVYLSRTFKSFLCIQRFPWVLMGKHSAFRMLFSVKVNDIEEEALEIFNKLKSEKGTKDENVVNFIEIVKVNIGAEAWEKFYELIEAKGIKRKDIVKFIDSDNGTNTIEFIHVSEKALVAINVNADETGKKTQQVLLFGKENDVDKEGLEIFKKETLSRKISEENIKDLTEPDEGTNVFEIVYKSNKVLVACVDNVYKDAKTRFAVIFVKVNDIEAEALEKFNELVKVKKIEDKNVLKILEASNGIILFPKYEISLTWECPPCAKLWSSKQAEYEGENVFAVTHASRNILVAHNINVDEHGKKTVLTGLFVKVNIEEEGLQKFKELTQEKGIKEKNVVNFIETETWPPNELQLTNVKGTGRQPTGCCAESVCFLLNSEAPVGTKSVFTEFRTKLGQGGILQNAGCKIEICTRHGNEARRCTYTVDYEGKNIFEVKYASKKILVAHTHNEDNDGQRTELAGVFGKGDIFIFTSTLS
ncbi:hypothetical protein MJT46_019125 [Ovis ammon polii x Ovis aries]|nr:hypothetical protein MJT46_019125 [Ovis ammon polii x Ovis aries]